MKFIIALALIPLALFSEIKTISSMKELPQLIPARNALIVFDIDYTLLIPEEPAFQPKNYLKQKGFLKKRKSNWSDEMKGLIPNMMTAYSETTLIEEDTPKIISKLRNQGNRVIALSAAMTSLENMSKLRKESLEKQGILFFHSSDYTFDELNFYNNSYPQALCGILLSNGEGNTKSEVLLAYLSRENFKPSTIVFVEDKKENLIEMQEALEKRGINYIGVLYTGAMDYPSPPISDEEFRMKWINLEKKAKDYANRN